VKRIILMATCALVLAGLMPTAPAIAQDAELREYTTEQRWRRQGRLLVDLYSAVVALGEANDMTAEEVGSWIGEFYVERGWMTGMDADGFTRWLHRNVTSMTGAEAEVVGSDPDSITVRFNRPVESRMGAGDQNLGVSAGEIGAMLRAIDEAIAEGVGIGLEREIAEDHDVLTITSLYGQFDVANNDIRWARAGFFNWLNWLQFMSAQKASGKTAREIGEADAALHAPGWSGSRTPWQLLRGMIWNEMSNPNAECEVLSASADEVRARCRQYWIGVVEANEESFGVTPEDVYESGRAFRQGVAEYLGMKWSQEIVDGWVVMTVSRGEGSD